MFETDACQRAGVCFYGYCGIIYLKCWRIRSAECQIDWQPTDNNDSAQTSSSRHSNCFLKLVQRRSSRVKKNSTSCLTWAFTIIFIISQERVTPFNGQTLLIFYQTSESLSIKSNFVFCRSRRNMILSAVCLRSDCISADFKQMLWFYFRASEKSFISHKCFYLCCF